MRSGWCGMPNLLICTGKKRAVKKVVDYFKALEKQHKIEIFATTQKSKKAMVWSYEELKLLFQRTNEGEPLEIEKGLVSSLDMLQVRNPNGVVVKMSSLPSERAELRWDIISRTTSFQLRGGKVDLREENHGGARICHLTLAGPVGSVFVLRDLLIKERIVDSKTVEYVL